MERLGIEPTLPPMLSHSARLAEPFAPDSLLIGLKSPCDKLNIRPGARGASKKTSGRLKDRRLLMRQEVRKFTSANYLDGVVVTLTCAAAFAAFAFGAVQEAAGDDSMTWPGT
jgi:hypothetical protein